MSAESAKERDIMMVMRKVLTSIIRDITPPAGAPHPLSANTIEDVKMCLGLIAARERELADAAGVAQERPYYVDGARPVEVVPVSSIGRRAKPGADG